MDFARDAKMNMASKRNSTKNRSLAERSRAKKQLFLPMAAAKAEGLALRFRLALNVAVRGQGSASDLRVLSRAVVMTGLIADIETSSLSDRHLAACEAVMAAKIASRMYSSWGVSPSEEPALVAVINEHDRQLRQSRLQTIVLATERLARLTERVDTLEKVFAARREENARKTNGERPE